MKAGSVRNTDTTGCDVSIHPDDYLCYNCYKLHTSILKSLEPQLQEPDCMLWSLTEIWRAKASDKDTDRFTVAVVKAALFVAEQLLQQKAVLLPQASQVFLQAYGVNHIGGIKSVELNLEVGEGAVQFCSRWLLNQLIVYLSPYMSYKCVHMKFGTILYRKEVDLLTSLSWALGTVLHLQAHASDEDGETLIREGPNDSTYKQRVLSEAGYIE